ncbi:MAG TPA: oligosaccharyl transferase, archaeosortase A system-associated, partial [Methanospirillum sp.]|nr:oligosaccharyl transferase, archaeosortase A system-associated [Methanospirillum sp.]
LGGYVLDPVDDVSALRHFRLIYESSMNSSHLFSPDSDPRLLRVPYIKVFEYVPGARIPGEGTIVVEMITNTGREFIYQQKSQNGEFIVPYSTEENTFGVRTKGKYHIVETGREFAVSERDVKWGRQITQ